MQTMSEPWTPIPGCPGYGADEHGQIWSTSNWRGSGSRVLTAFPDNHGYLKVRVVRDGRRVPQAVHKLVALAFLGPPPPNHEVRHLNGDRQHNRPENLAWGTRAENAADRELHGRTARGSAVGRSRLTVDDIRAIRANAGFEGQRTLAAAFGVSQSQVGRIIRGESWAHV